MIRSLIVSLAFLMIFSGLFGVFYFIQNTFEIKYEQAQEIICKANMQAEREVKK